MSAKNFGDYTSTTYTPDDPPSAEAPKANGSYTLRSPADHRADNASRNSAFLKSARASTFELSAIQWLWPNRFALGKLGILGGLPDEGKGQIFADMAARVTRG